MSIKKVLGHFNNLNILSETIIYSISIIVVFILAFFFPVLLNTNLKYFILMSFVTIFGMPHGALDSLLARKKLVYKTKLGFLAFNILYLVLAFITFLIWKHYSFIMLMIFLFISIYHFSEDWENVLNLPDRLIFTSGIICLPSLFHADEVLKIYSVLTSSSYLHAVVIYQKYFAYIILLSNLFFFYKYLKSYDFLIQAFLIIFSSYLFEPIFFFVCYFCFFHSIKNFKDIILDINVKVINKGIFINILITILLGILMYIFFLQGTIEKKIINLVFIGLASLTVPHMLLKAYINIKNKK